MRAHPGPDGRWIRCDARGHCRWMGKTPVAAARSRLYAASRGALPSGTRVETTCGQPRCVNVDHLRVARDVTRESTAAVPLCMRGHELTGANAVRHRDGRVAYCRLCRNERRRERYRHDAVYAAIEVERQRRRRRSAAGP